MFPNPASDYINIKIDPGLNLNNKSLSVFNSMGKMVMGIPMIRSNQMKINTSGLSCGMYFICITDNNKIITAGKFIVK